MSDPRFDESELPQKNRLLRRRGDRFGLVVATVAAAGLVVMAVLYTMTSERHKPTPQSSAETSQKSPAPGPGKK
jgi:hypothetical protein